MNSRSVIRLVVKSLSVLVCASGAILTTGLATRNFTSLGSYYKPVGARLTGGIDLNDPKPFQRLQLGKVVVGLASSGGGSRAAYLTAAVLREIHRNHLKVDTEEQASQDLDLLSQFEIVSSVSGGSLAATYFVANNQRLAAASADSNYWWDYLDKMAVGYRRREWYKYALMNPTAWIKFFFTNYNRGLLARDDYDKTLFHGATLADLPGRPALYVNSFDVANHVRFVFSKNYIDTTYYQPKDWWGELRAPQELTSENDLGFCDIDPRSIKLADAVYASSAFPVAYPNLALNHFGSKILFQGSLIFLADGGLADNSGLITLLTLVRRGVDRDVIGVPDIKGVRLLVLYVDASTTRIYTEGSQFQHRGNERRYAWHDTVVGHGIAAIDGANDLMQDLSWKFVESTGVVVDQVASNWPTELTASSSVDGGATQTSWGPLLKSGTLALRPLVIRLGLRDVPSYAFVASDPAFENADDPELRKLLKENGIEQIGSDPAPTGEFRRRIDELKEFDRRLENIETDFALSTADRHAIDLAAYLLVQGLAHDLRRWSTIA